MGEMTTVGLDIAKPIFVAHGADAAGNNVLTGTVISTRWP
jgi:hypothetical protein